MRHLFLVLVLPLTACAESEPEPFDYECGDIVCEGSTEACWKPDCGASDGGEYQCKPIDEDNNACQFDGEGYTCEQICG